MKRARLAMVNAALAALLAASAPGLAQSGGNDPAFGRRVLEAHIQPSFEGFGESTSKLGEAIDSLCDAPGTSGLEQARQAFAGTVAAWGVVSVLRFGPLTADDRFERIFFWPDPRGVTTRQVQALLSE